MSLARCLCAMPVTGYYVLCPAWQPTSLKQANWNKPQDEFRSRSQMISLICSKPEVNKFITSYRTLLSVDQTEALRFTSSLTTCFSKTSKLKHTGSKHWSCILEPKVNHVLPNYTIPMNNVLYCDSIDSFSKTTKWIIMPAVGFDPTTSLLWSDNHPQVRLVVNWVETVLSALPLSYTGKF